MNLGYYEYTKKYQLVELQCSWHPSSFKNEQIYTWKCDVNAILVFIFSLGLHKIFCCVSLLIYSIKPHAHYVFILAEKRHPLKWKKGNTNRCEKKTVQIPKMKKEVLKNNLFSLSIAQNVLASIQLNHKHSIRQRATAWHNSYFN